MKYWLSISNVENYLSDIITTAFAYLYRYKKHNNCIL